MTHTAIVYYKVRQRADGTAINTYEATQRGLRSVGACAYAPAHEHTAASCYVHTNVVCSPGPIRIRQARVKLVNAAREETARVGLHSLAVG